MRENIVTKKILLSAAVVIAGIILIDFVVEKIIQQEEISYPRLSSRAGEVSPSSEFLNALRAVDYYRDEIKKHPDRVKNYIALAQLYQQEARVTANEAHYLPKAQYLLTEALRRNPEDIEALTAQAALYMTYHQFKQAKEVISKVIAKNDFNAAAYGVLVDALVELGEYETAVKACDKMLSIRPDIRSYSRASYLRELHGDIPGAIAAMRLAADAGVTGQENRAWTLSNLGNLYLQQEKVDTALFIFKGILEERPLYAPAIVGIAKIKTLKKEYSEAIKLLADAYHSTPYHGLLEQLAAVFRYAGMNEKADSAASLVLKGFEDDLRMGHNAYGEFAAFAIQHNTELKKGLEYAQKDYEYRPENIKALETYAWALLLNGNPELAAPLIEKAMRLQTKTPQLLYRAGIIFQQSGNDAMAKELLKEAMKQHLSLHQKEFEHAKIVLAALQETDKAHKSISKNLMSFRAKQSNLKKMN